MRCGVPLARPAHVPSGLVPRSCPATTRTRPDKTHEFLLRSEPHAWPVRRLRPAAGLAPPWHEPNAQVLAKMPCSIAESVGGPPQPPPPSLPPPSYSPNVGAGGAPMLQLTATAAVATAEPRPRYRTASMPMRYPAHTGGRSALDLPARGALQGGTWGNSRERRGSHPVGPDELV